MAILGNDSGWAVYKPPANVLIVNKSVATSSGPVNNSTALFNANASYSNDFKMALYSSAGVLLGVSLPVTVAAGAGSRVYKNFTWSTSPSIVSGNTYYVGLLSANSSRDDRRAECHWEYVTGEGGAIFNSYSVPTNFDPASLVTNYYRLRGYITYTASGPALKIEGITPGKLEYTSWSLLSDVK